MTKARKTILVVEDEPVIRMAAVDILDAAGFEIVEAASTAEAIKLLERPNQISLVFTDIDMPPGADGISLAKEVTSRWPPIKILITSGKFRSSDLAIPNGCVFCSKPYRERDLLFEINRLV